MNIRRRTEEDTITATEPSFASLALAGQPPPDWADVVIVPLPQGAHGGPRFWAERVFDGSDLPKPVLTLMGLRQFLVRLVGIGPAPSTVFDVAAVVGDEALIVELEDHLDFRCGVGRRPRGGAAAGDHCRVAPRLAWAPLLRSRLGPARPDHAGDDASRRPAGRRLDLTERAGGGQ